jgi:hypothetical protein
MIWGGSSDTPFLKSSEFQTAVAPNRNDLLRPLILDFEQIPFSKPAQLTVDLITDAPFSLSGKIIKLPSSNEHEPIHVHGKYQGY